ncbi:MAG: response regulator [Campylobacterota bacterium]|nr:response regulator [Campylobacterota bacterium]
MSKTKVIIVEDELLAAEYLKEILEEHDVEVIDIIDNGKEAITSCIAQKPDVIFMDIMLHDNISGSEAAVAISREVNSKIIFLTAYTDPEMVDYAVESHAAGYLTKPYNEMQIIATLRLTTQDPLHVSSKETAVKKEQTEDLKLINGFIYNREQKRLLKNTKQIELGPKALKLIDLLCEHPDISISDEQISMHVWSELVNDRTLRSLIFRIRAATEEDLIKNVSGTGYMIQTA